MTTTMNSGGSRPAPGQSRALTSGWATFGGAMLFLLGMMNIIHGITALQYDDLLVNQYVFDNLTFWGWTFVIWGALQIAAGGATLVGTTWGPSLGMTLATIGAVGWFFMIFAAPGAAILGVIVSITVVASLATVFSE